MAILTKLLNRSALIRLVFSLLLLSSGLQACRAAPTPASSSPGVTALLTPYSSPTPSRTPTPQWLDGDPGSRTPHPTIPPPPTPTPFTYEVKKGDTLSVIAFRYGISLEDLMAANADVNPRILSVGTKLVIPIAPQKGTPEAAPSPTPLAIPLGPPDCYPSAEGALWCFVVVSNERQQALENISAYVTVSGPGLENIPGVMALPPLDILPPGKSAPLVAYFPAPAGGKASSAEVQAKLVSGFLLAADSQRYLPARATLYRTDLSSDGLAATLQGKVELESLPTARLSPSATLNAGGAPAPQPSPTLSLTGTPESQSMTASQVWLALIAYDQQGRIVGVRKWEAPKKLVFGKKIEFEVAVYSLGPPIQTVELLVEARP